MDSERLLDDVGWRILQELQQDARLSYAELGRRVGLTLPAVAERVRRLEEAGVIVGYRARVNRAKLGLPITAFIRVATPSERQGNSLVAMAKELPEVLECHRVTGDDSYVLKVAVTSVLHLEKILSRFTGLGQPTTSIILSSPVSHKVVRPLDPTQIPEDRSHQEESASIG